MQAGVIGVVDGSFEVVDSFATTERADGRDLHRCLDVDRVFSLPSGEPAFEGRAAREVVTERELAHIDGGGVSVATETATETRHARFAGVPGEFVVAGSSSGAFAFDLIGVDTNTAVERASLDLDAFYDRRSAATPWKAGFVGAGEGDVGGVLHGENLRNGHDFGDLLSSASLNQVGLEHDHDGEDVKMTATQSGYVELYRPSSFGTGPFLEYLREEIVPHLQQE